jgi:thymidylate kinase
LSKKALAGEGLTAGLENGKRSLMEKPIDFQSVQPPGILLILGTDASGKNYVANYIADILDQCGHISEKRDGAFSKPAEALESSEDKGALALFKEKAFLTLFPYIRFLLPPLVSFLIRRDLKRFQPSENKVLVISHTPIRILAFYLGHQFEESSDIRLPRYLASALGAIAPTTQAKTLVLDISPHIRQARIAKRVQAGKVDNFDRYMAGDTELSERIERFLVWIGQRYLGAVTLLNDDLDEAELSARIYEAFCGFAGKGRAGEGRRG